MCMTWSDVGALLSGIKVVNAADAEDYNFVLLEKLQIYPFLWEIWYKLSQSTLYESEFIFLISDQGDFVYLLSSI